MVRFPTVPESGSRRFLLGEVFENWVVLYLQEVEQTFVDDARERSLVIRDATVLDHLVQVSFDSGVFRNLQSLEWGKSINLEPTTGPRIIFWESVMVRVLKTGESNFLALS